MTYPTSIANWKTRTAAVVTPAAIRSAAGSVFSDVERSVLARPDNPSRWTVADVPLLDELAELLGVDDSAAKAARRALERAQRLETQYAQEVLDSTGVADLGLVDAETLAAWNRDNGPSLSTAERAGARPDRPGAEAFAAGSGAERAFRSAPGAFG